jgi:hypothetical protein
MGPTLPFAALAAAFGVWAFLLQAGTDYTSLPESVVANPLYSTKFFASLVLVAVSVRWLNHTRRSDLVTPDPARAQPT